MTKGRWADIASGWASALDPTLLGFGLFLAWAQCMPWVKSHVVGFSGLSGVNVTLHGLILIGMALVANYRHVRISSSPTVLAAGALTTLVPCLSFLATLGGDIAVACSIAEGVVEGASLAAFYLLWHEQHARRPQRAAWTGYAASFAVAPLAYFLVTALPGPLGLATTVALPPASCLLLWLCMRRDWFSTDAGERVPEDDNASRPWRIPWRPALLMAVFSFTYYMLLHLFSGMSAMGQLGNLGVAVALLVACAELFDRFDARTLYKACPVLMVCALLSLTQELTTLSSLGNLLASAGYTGFTLFICFILNSICFRYEAPASWLFGIVLGCSALAHAAGSVVGAFFSDVAASDPQVADALLDAAVVALVALSLALLSERDFSTTWGIRPSGMAGGPADDAESGANATGAAHAGATDAPRHDAGGAAAATARGDDQGARQTGVRTSARATTSGYYEDFVWRCSRVARHYGLTHREEEVLALVAQGKTSQNIEAALFISHNTAKGHLRHVYAKLGVHSREEAASLVTSWR